MSEESLKIADIFNITGKVVLVTGGARGIGYCMTKSLISNGADVIMVSRSEEGEKIAEKFTEMGPGKCYFVRLDLSVFTNIKLLPSKLEEIGITSLHGLINNSGIVSLNEFGDFTEEDFDSVINLNLKTVFFVTQVLTPLLEKTGIANDPARVINVGSMVGIRHVVS